MKNKIIGLCPKCTVHEKLYFDYLELWYDITSKTCEKCGEKMLKECNLK